jgi:hypothetical protein
MLSDKMRKMLLDFLSQHAEGDVLIQAANRVANNMEDVETLRKFITEYKAPLHASDYLNTKVATALGDVERAKERIPEVTESPIIDHPEDLGPVPKKLGANGQAIETLMRKKHDHEFTIDGLKDALHLPAAKIKPMLALLLHRNIIERASNWTYKVK